MKKILSLTVVIITVASLLLSGCTTKESTTASQKETQPDTTVSEPETTTVAEPETTTVAEPETTTVAEPETTTTPTIQELQKLIPSSYINVGEDIGKWWEVGFHEIPDICQWDDELGYYVAPDNGTNENGEAITIKVTYEEIDKSELYSDKLNEINNMLETNKDSYSEYQLEYNHDWQALAYYYATEEAITNENGNMTHTFALFELRRYDGGQNANNYSSLVFEVDILKPEELTQNTISKYFGFLYDSITISYTESA